MLLFISSPSVYGQDTTTINTTDTLAHRYPKAVLVQLRSEHNRMDAMERNRSYKELAQVKNDAVQITTRMIADFHDHFNFCPVYFYVDTNLDLVKSRKFQGVLFNADSTPVTNPVISDTSQDYLIVYYGYPETQMRTEDSAVREKLKTYDYGDPRYPPKESNLTQRELDETRSHHIYGDPMGRGLVICNYRMQQVSFLYKFGYDELFFKAAKKYPKYAYSSRHFDMEYFPYATKFNQVIVKAQTKIRITHYPNFFDFVDLLSQ